MSNKEENIRNINNIVCKKCNSMSSYELIKTCNIFHIFFIPIIKWNEKYYLKSRCCDTIFQVSKDIGKKLERGENVSIEDGDLTEVYSNYGWQGYNPGETLCSYCGSRVDASFKYCPNCGHKIL